MYSIARSFLCSTLLGAAIISHAAAQSVAVRRAQLDIERTLHDGARPIGFRFTWGNARLQGGDDLRKEISLSDYLVERDDADFAMYSEPFTVPAGGGTLTFSSDAVIARPVDRAASRADQGEMVMQQMIELVDAATEKKLRGVYHGFLRVMPHTDPADASRSRSVTLDLAEFAGRKVRLRALLVTYAGGTECKTCEAPYRFTYQIYRGEASTAPGDAIHPSIR